jgi:hypothetical protein
MKDRIVWLKMKFKSAFLPLINILTAKRGLPSPVLYPTYEYNSIYDQRRSRGRFRNYNYPARFICSFFNFKKSDCTAKTLMNC